MVLLKIKFPFEKRVRLAQGLWLLSWLATIGASFTFTLGCFLKTELARRSEVMDNTEIHAVPNTLMMVGLVCMGINFFTGRICLDALEPGRFPRWKSFMKPFFGFSIFIAFLMLVSVVMSYAMKGNLERSLKVGLKNGIRFYKDTDTPGRCFQKQTIDRMQMEFRCCGNTDFKDWFEVQWISNRYLDFGSKEVKDRIKSNVDGRYLVDGVPFSCCNPSSPRPCIQYQLTNNSVHYNYDYQTEELNIYIRGCREALVYYYMGLMNSIGAGVLSIFLVQTSVLVSLRYLQTSMDAVDGQENQEMETEGYLLEKGVKETIKEYMDPVLKVLMINQVDAAATGEKKAEEGEKPGTSAGGAEKQK
ncbi:RDS/peripherin-like protein xRDS35 [Anguilla rostrata]|uniref:RDS/peripherin-like protein xRDS35 n=1 Tax=Anguilla rostrata TaxID=7938 RepID=UPI0030D42FD0